ncbi:FIST signal transduction protein [Natronomonas marina]|jgi:methyl-accepting chemotaxis protein|uniref:FIST signal transduction protein n=1 Tax=Natronomonas marina TaxID=2961939 RepID=UPI0020CA2028|nr:FIST N-terminal domain-containing protein [Natronomonas marina]
MTTSFGTGLRSGTDGRTVGEGAAADAMAAAGVDGQPGLAVVFCSSRYDYEAVLDGVRGATEGAPLLGCSSAGEFTEAGVESGSVGVAVLDGDTHRAFTGLGRGLRADETAAMEAAAREVPPRVEGYPHRSAVILHDGLSGNGEELSLAVPDVLGPDTSLAGGSAGDDLEMEATHVFRNETVAEDAVALGAVASKRPVQVGVAHGHETISPPLEVTAADGNVVHELDGEPAYEVWKDHVREEVAADGHDLDALEPGEEALSAALTNYAFGLETGNGLKVRWPGPTKTTDGPMEFTCSIPEGTVMRVTAGTNEAQKASARRAARAAMAGTDGDVAGALVFDCICRSTALGDGFDEAVAGMYDELGVPMLGFETYGELAMERGQLSGYHNTTSVVMVFPE